MLKGINQRIARFVKAAEAEQIPSPGLIQQPPAARPSPSIRKAYCKNDAGSGNTIACYLDTDGTGKEITVLCNISRGSDLNAAAPRLKDGDPMWVVNNNGTWESLVLFYATINCVCD